MSHGDVPCLPARDFITEMEKTLKICSGMSRESWQAAVRRMCSASP